MNGPAPLAAPLKHGAGIVGAPSRRASPEIRPFIDWPRRTLAQRSIFSAGHPGSIHKQNRNSILKSCHIPVVYQAYDQSAITAC